MTDEELERLAHAADYSDDGEAWLLRFQTRSNNDYHTRLMKAVTPRAVLALLERMRKAEARADHNGRIADAASDDVDTLIRRVEVAEEREHTALDRAKAAEAKSEEWRTKLRDAQRYGNLLDQMFPSVMTLDATTDTLIQGYGDAIEALQGRTEKAESDVSGAAEWARALEVRLDSWRELHKEVEARAKKAEAALLCDHGAEKEYCAASHNAAVDAARRAALETALRLAEDVEREEGEQGRTGPASGAGEVKGRIKEHIRWLDEGTE